MKLIEIDINCIPQIVFELKNNNAICMQSDTIPGIFSLNKNLLYLIKNRSSSKKVIKLISDYNNIPNFNNNPIYIDFAKRFWPGPITAIINKESYRIPNNTYLQLLLTFFPYIYSTSANFSNQQVIKSLEDINNNWSKNFHDSLFIVNNFDFDSNISSTIVDLDNLKIIRKGVNAHLVQEFINEWISKK